MSFLFCVVNGVGVDIFGDGLSHGGPVEVDAMSIVDDTVEDGVGEGWFVDDIVPLFQQWDIKEVTGTSVCSIIAIKPDEHCDGQEYFPFSFSAEYTIAIRDLSLKFDLLIKSTCDYDQPLAVGWHPYFHKDSQCTVCIPADKMWELDDKSERTPTGRLLPLSRENDFRLGRKIMSNERWDDIFVFSENKGAKSASCWMEEKIQIQQLDDTLKNINVRRIVQVPSGRSGSAGEQMRHIQLYTPPDRKAIALEPLSAPPDAINLHDQRIEHSDLCILKPGVARKFSMVLRLELFEEKTPSVPNV